MGTEKKIFAPRYRGISVEKAIEFCRSFPQVWKYLPEEKYIYNLPRDFTFNVMNTVIPDEFTPWINGLIALRDAEQKETQDLDIQVTEAALEAFKKSTHQSCK